MATRPTARAAANEAVSEQEKAVLETDTTEADVETPEPEKAKSGDFIAFKGHNGVRIISKEDWEAIEIKGQDGKVWDKRNAWRIPADEFSKAALNYLLNVDGEFQTED